MADFKTDLWVGCPRVPLARRRLTRVRAQEGTPSIYERYTEGKAQAKDCLAIVTARVVAEERYAKEMAAIAGNTCCPVTVFPRVRRCCRSLLCSVFPARVSARARLTFVIAHSQNSLSDRHGHTDCRVARHARHAHRARRVPLRLCQEADRRGGAAPHGRHARPLHAEERTGRRGPQPALASEQVQSCH